MTTIPYVIKQKSDVIPTPCPCGSATRIITALDGAPVSVHSVLIKKDSEIHYHKKQTEIYYVIRGQGEIYLDGHLFPISEGSTIMIPPGVRHRAIGDLEIINVVYPPFDPEDEYIDEVNDHE
jgi:mannose-6-phosphate isomerase-like protein (cupin superfamily)